MSKRPYRYLVLKYIHDVLSAECLNVGVLVFSPSHEDSTAVVKFKGRRTIGRLKEVFPDLQRPAFTAAMNAVERATAKVAKDLNATPLLSFQSTIEELAARIVPVDESSFRWSIAGGGLTSNLEETLERLFERMVSAYDVKHQSRKSDDEVWKPVRLRLEEMSLASRLHEKTIKSGVDEIAFKHAWKNGKWHVYQPLSLDLADAEGIKDKARRWLGHLTAVGSDPDEEFKPYFIVGEPSDPSLKGAYGKAIEILRQAPLKPEVFEEKDVDNLVAQIEDDVRVHDGRTA